MEKRIRSFGLSVMLLFACCFFSMNVYATPLLGELQAQTLVKNEDVVIRVTGVTQSEDYFKVQTEITNHTDKCLFFDALDVLVNGVAIEMPVDGYQRGTSIMFHCAVAAGVTEKDAIYFSLSDMEKKDIARFNTLKFSISVTDVENDEFDYERELYSFGPFELHFAKHTHSYGPGVVTKEPTCAEEGVRTYTCEADQETKTESIPATGEHTMGEWKVVKTPVCENAGVAERQCTICGYKETRKLKAPGHRWSKWEVTKKATCSKTGVMTRHCTVCNKTETKEIPATGKHSWSKWKKVTPATIKAKGKAERTCSVCGKKGTKAIARLKPFVSFSKKTYKVKKGKTLKLKISYAAGDKVQSWKSSKKSVATVSSKGKIKAKKAGTTKITVVMKSGKKATCKVKVTKK